MQMSQSIFGRIGGWWLSSYASLPQYISAAVNRAIQLAQNKKTAAPLSSGNQKRKQMNVSFLHNSFSVDPSTEMFTDSYHPPSYSHLSLDTFQKTRPFHLSSRCEEICSLMAFKTGSTDDIKKGRSEKNATLPTLSPRRSRTSVNASFEETSAAAHCHCAKVPTVPVTLTSICRQLDTISPTTAYSH